MASSSVLKIAGLHTSDNPHSAVPEGALALATNAVMRYRNRLGPRRGQRQSTYTFGSGSDRANEGVFYQDTLIQHYATTKLTRDTGSAFTDYSGSYTPVDAAALRMKFIEAASNLYFCTTVGMKLLESATSTPASAGVLRARELDYVLYSQAPWYAVDYDANGWMAPDTAVAYRFVWGIKDANGNIKLGAPSGRFIVRNRMPVVAPGVVRNANVVTVASLSQMGTGDVIELINEDATFGAGPHTITGTGVLTITYAETAANATSAKTYYYGFADGVVDLIVPVPSGITTSHFLRIYRTEETPTGDLEPSEDFYLTKEISVTSSDITAKFVAATDYTPSSQLDVALYTNPNDGEGETAAKFQPPICKDMCWWDNRLWCLNTTDKHRFFLRLVGVGSPDGVQDADTITINGTTLIAETGSVAGLEFSLFTSGEPSQNIEFTAKAIVTLINENTATLGVVAYYVSGVDDPAGNILIEETAIGGSAITVYASRPASWGPALTTGSSGAKTSTNDARPHGASYSDVDEPEAFPINNWLPIAPKGVALLRGIPFRDKIYCFGDNRKIYVISGQAPYRVDEIDGSVRLIAPDSVVVHANQVFALTDQGVGILSEAGFRIVSNGIEDELLDVLALTAATVKRYSFAVSYESERQVIFYVPTGSSDTCAKAAYVYDSLRGVWTKWTGDRTWARVRNSTDKLYLGDGGSNTTRVERKAYDRTDYGEDEVAVAVSGSSGNTSVTVYSSGGIVAGDVLTQSGGPSRKIVAVDSGANMLTLDAAAQYAIAAATVVKAIAVAVKFQPVSPFGPRGDAHFQECCFHFGEYFCADFTATFDSNLDVTASSAPLTDATLYSANAHETAVPAAALGLRNRLCEVPQEHAQCAMLRVGFTISEAWASWLLDGFTLQYEAAGRSYD